MMRWNLREYEQMVRREGARRFAASTARGVPNEVPTIR